MDLLQSLYSNEWVCISCGQKFPSRFDAVNHFCGGNLGIVTDVYARYREAMAGHWSKALASAMSGGGARGATQAVDYSPKPPGRQLLNDQYALSNDGMSITCTQCGESFYDMDDVSAHVCPVKMASVSMSGVTIVHADPAKDLAGHIGQIEGVTIHQAEEKLDPDPDPPERNPIDDVMEITRRFFGG